MRASGIVGILVIVLAVVVLLGGSFGTRRDVLQVGDLKVTASQRQSVPPWVSGLAIIAGVVLVISGRRQKA